MTGLPWYAQSIESYERKTAHLTMLQHGAYRLMLDHYYKLASPLPAKHEQVHRICRVDAEEERAAVNTVLAEFFHLEDDGWHNDRADEELAKMYSLREKRRKAAKNSHNSRANAPASAPANASTKAHAKAHALASANGGANADTLNTKQSSPNGEDTRGTLLSKICSELGVGLDLTRHRWPGDLSAALASGLTETQLLEASKTARTKGKDTLAYVIGAARGIARDRANGNKHAAASSQPIVFKPAKDDAEWLSRIESWRATCAKYPDRTLEDCWPDHWGGPPGAASCKIPPHLLEGANNG